MNIKIFVISGAAKEMVQCNIEAASGLSRSDRVGQGAGGWQACIMGTVDTADLRFRTRSISMVRSCSETAAKIYILLRFFGHLVPAETQLGASVGTACESMLGGKALLLLSTRQTGTDNKTESSRSLHSQRNLQCGNKEFRCVILSIVARAPF